MLRGEGFELVLSGAKRISDCDLGVLMPPPVFLVIAIDNNLGPIGEGEVNSDLFPLALGVVLMRLVERHSASCDLVIELL
jgi:hypothetical protein